MRAGVGVLALALAFGIFGVLFATKPETPKEPRQERALIVPVVTVRPVQAPRVWEGFGTARAKAEADVAAEVSGVIAERPASIDPGRRVEAGELIVQIQDEEYADRVAASEAVAEALRADLQGLEVEVESTQETLALAERAVELTRTELERFRDAAVSAGVQQIEIDRLERQLTQEQRAAESLRERLSLLPTRRGRLEAQLASARADLRLAQRNLDRTRIVAPIAGVLQSVETRKGERVSVGTPIARIVDLSVMEVPLSLPVSAGASVRVGSPAELSTGGDEPTVWEGAVARIAPEADEGTRTLTVFVEVEQDPESRARLLRAGRFVMGRVEGGRSLPRLVVPRSAVREDRLVTVDESSRARLCDVNVLYQLDGRFPALHPRETQWSVVEGELEPGDRVIISLLGSMTPGRLVRPADVADPEPVDPQLTDANGEERPS